MYLTRHRSGESPAWARDGHFLPASLSLGMLLQLPRQAMIEVLQAIPAGEPAVGTLLPPIESIQEVWASGVTYLRSRDARTAESEVGDIYAKVYNATRPELFFKAAGWRVAGPAMPIRVRRDSRWNVPEPELVLVINSQREIVGFCAGNDVSSRDIEGENPLYLPQAKIYNGSCALGPGLYLAEPAELKDLSIQLEIYRDNLSIFQGDTRTVRMKRDLEELAAYLTRELEFPYGVFLMTGTGIVPPDEFTLQVGDRVRITVASLILENEVTGES